MRVTILTDLYEHKEEFINNMWTAASTCYSAKRPSDLIGIAANEKETKDKIALLEKVVASGHHSILEHVNITFAVEGISRSASHQLVRHRLVTYSQQSQRYVNFENKCFDYVTPSSIENSELNKEYHLVMEQLKNFYDRAVAAGVKPEDARYVLPNAACTNLTITTNLRNIIHVLGLRCCTRAQWEIRAVFRELAKQLQYAFPWLKEQLDANCSQLGFCPEGEKCCGASKSLEQIKDELQTYHRIASNQAE